MSRVMIAIPSKGRPDSPVIAQLCGVENMRVFIEPQDVDAYGLSEAVILPENDRGIGYSRNQILQYSIANGFEYTLFLDDDTVEFFRLHDIPNWKYTKISLLDFCNEIGNAVAIAETNGISLMGFGHMFTASRQRFDISWGVNIGQPSMLNNAAGQSVGGHDPEMRLLEDLDLNLKLQLAGFKTALWCGYAYQTPTYGNAASKGGCSEDYKNYREGFVEVICARYPEYVTPRVRKNGELGVRTSWMKLRKNAAAKIA